MRTYLKEKIGNPELFTGRKKELDYFLNWIDKSKNEISKSTAVLSRRKTGKSALLQRLFNLTFHKNDRIIPFYFEVREAGQWLADFSTEFFLTFIYQYIAFKTRKPEYIDYSKQNFERAAQTIQKENLSYLFDIIEDIQVAKKEGFIDGMWNIAREAPRIVAQYNDERVIQFVDEFQFVNRFIYRTKACTSRIKDFAGTWLHTCEYKDGTGTY